MSLLPFQKLLKKERFNIVITNKAYRVGFILFQLSLGTQGSCHINFFFIFINFIQSSLWYCPFVLSFTKKSKEYSIFTILGE